METTIYVRDCTPSQMRNLFDNKENRVNIRFYQFIPNKLRYKVLVRHPENILFKENACYTFNGFLKKIIK